MITRSTNGASAYDAFVSYSHAADGQLAPALQAALQSLGKPWYRRRMLRVFRDKTSLSASPELWPAIESALAASRFFVLLASPEAAASRWVDQEVRWWLEHRSPTTMLIAVTGGEVAWDPARQGFDPIRSTALPRAALDWPAEEPFWVDLRWAREARHVSLRDPRFREVVADVAAPVRGLPKDDLIGEDIRQHRRALRLARGAVVGLLLLAVAASVSAVVAVQRQKEARRQERDAISRLLAAAARNQIGGRLDRALLLAAEASRLNQTAESRDALITALQYDARRRTYVWPGARVDAVAFSPDGRVLVASGEDDDHREGPFPVTVTDVRDGRRIATMSRRARALDLAFSPDGKLLALADDLAAGASVTFWDTSTWRQQGPPLPVKGASSLSFSTTGRMLAVGGTYATSLWDVATRKRLEAVRGSPRSPGAKALISGDSRLLAVGAGETIRVWPLRSNGHTSQSAVRIFTPFRLQEVGEVTELAFSPDGKLLAAGGRSGAVAVLDTGSGSAITRFQAHTRGRTWGSESPVTGLVFRRDGRTLLSAGNDGIVRTWNARSGTPQGPALRGHEGGVAGLALAPDDRTLASGGVDERIAIWDLEKADGLGELAASAPALDGLRLTKAEEGLHIPRPTHEYAGFAWPISSSRSSPSTIQAFAWRGPQLLVTRWDEAGRLQPPLAAIDVGSGEEWQRLTAALSPDQRTLVVGTGTGNVAFFDARTGRLLSPVTSAHGSEVWAFAFSSDGRTMVSIGVGEGSTARPDLRRSLIVWSVRSHVPLGAPLTGHQTFVTALALDRQGHRAVTGSGPEAFVWDIRARRLVRRMKGHAPGPRSIGPTGSSPDEDVWSTALSPDGHSLATWGQDGTIRFYDLDAGRPVGDGVPIRTNGFVDQLSFSEDGTTLAATDGTQTFLLDTASRAPLGKPIPGRGVTGPASSIAFLQSGGTLRVWHHAPGSLLAQVCVRANRNLSRQEWERFVGASRPYHRTCRHLPEG